MDEKLKELLKHRIEAAIMAFAKAHKVKISGKVTRWDDWSTKLTADLWVRIEIEKDEVT